MPKTKLIVNSEGSETRVGVLTDGQLTDYFLERKRERGIAGNLYKGRVSRVLPGMQAAFVDLGPTIERKAYLYVADVLGGGDEKKLFAGYDSSDDDDNGDSKPSKSGRPRRKHAAQRKIEDLVKEGQEILVQVVKEPVGKKGARVTGYISLPGRHCVFMPTVDRVGVSHRISSEAERKRLRDVVRNARPEGAGFIIRTAADGADADEVRDDVDYLIKLWKQVGARQKTMKKPGLLYSDLDMALRSIRDLLREDTTEWQVDSEEQYERARKFTEAFMPRYTERIKHYVGRQAIFDAFGVEAQLRTALQNKVPLSSGGSLVIEQGEALTAIDVNTGSFVGNTDLEDTITKNNLEACREVAHQLRLRNIGGIIVVDFVDMEKESNRKKVWEEYNKALANDPSRANVTRISELGLVEMTRKRTRESLNQLLTEPCPTCLGTGRVKSTTTVAYEVLREIRRVGGTVSAPRIDVEVPPLVAKLLEEYERGYLDGLEKRFHKQVVVTEDKTLGPAEYRVAGRVTKTEEEAPKRAPKRKSRSAKSASAEGSDKKSAGKGRSGSRGTAKTGAKSKTTRSSRGTKKKAVPEAEV